MAKVRFKPTKRSSHFAHGGPYAGETLSLANPQSGTMRFTANGQTGRYVYIQSGLHWVNN